MNLWIDIEVRKEQQKDLVREAEQRRAAGRARKQRIPASQLYAPILRRVGRWLHGWGTQLEARYSAPEPLSEARQPVH